mmetsp:Transcript_32503/g.85596  ORF Transcript_32503/g.85596 Transcript_32503/m.85596 type:complete len:127 (+) Transcript_32503:83-463(+)
MKTAAVFAANLLWWLLPMASGQNKLGDFPPQVLEKLSQEMDVIQEWWCVTKGNMDGEVCQAYYGKKGALNDEEMEAHMNPNKKEMEKMHQQYCRKFLKKEQREMSMSCVLWEERRKMIKKGGPLDL